MGGKKIGLRMAILATFARLSWAISWSRSAASAIITMVPIGCRRLLLLVVNDSLSP